MMRNIGAVLLVGIMSQIGFTTEPPDTAGAIAVSDGFDVAESDWPWWRGPLRNGQASANQQPPLEFGDSRNVLWKVDVPGRGHGSPTVFGEQVFLTTADETTGAQSVLSFDRATGKQLWETVVHASGGMMKNAKASASSSTPACDGERLIVNFPNAGLLVTTALSLSGEQLWQRTISPYQVHQGYGASPALYRNSAIVSSDNKLGGAVMALKRETGEILWQRERPPKPNYSSPTIVHVAGKDQLIMTGCDQIVSYDPVSGETLWETEGATTECVTTTVTNGELIYTSGGYPKDHMSALRADGTNEVAWENKVRLYVPSLVIHDGYLFAVRDAGIAMCWRAADGEEMWKARLGGDFSASPVLVGEQVFATSESGEFSIFKASPDGFELVAKNKLGDEVYATPTIVDGKIFHRVAYFGDSGERQEVLYCLGEATQR